METSWLFSGTDFDCAIVFGAVGTQKWAVFAPVCAVVEGAIFAARKGGGGAGAVESRRSSNVAVRCGPWKLFLQGASSEV